MAASSRPPGVRALLVVLAAALLAGCGSPGSASLGSSTTATAGVTTSEQKFLDALASTAPAARRAYSNAALTGAGYAACTSLNADAANPEAAVSAATATGVDDANARAIVLAAADTLCPASSAAGLAASAAPPTTSAPAAPPQVIEGRGDDVIDLAAPIGFGILVFECPKCKGNVVVKSDADYDDLLVNEIGSYAGKRWLNPRGGTTSRLQVQATGSWKATVGTIELARTVPGTAAVEGDGDDVVVMQSAPDTVRFTHAGSSNFVVQLAALSGNGIDLVVNEIGKYEGTVLFDVQRGEVAMMQVTADGRWTMTPRT